MSNSENTQLTPAKGYNTKRMIFSDPISGSIPNQKVPMSYKRINISSKNEDGTVGELVLSTPRLFSFGVSENLSLDSGPSAKKVNGYTFPLVLWNRDGASDEEKEWTDTFTQIVKKCINHLVDNREEIDRFELTKADLTKSKGGLDPLYWKREKVMEKGRLHFRKVPGTGPTLYTKLIYSKKTGKVLSQFFDKSDEPVDAMELMGKYCYARAAVKIESIFIGNRISLQVKLYEAVVEPTSTGMKRLLGRNKSKGPLSFGSNLNFSADSKRNFSETDTEDNSEDNSEDESDNGSIESRSDADEDDEKKPIKRTVKRIVKRKVKKTA